MSNIAGSRATFGHYLSQSFLCCKGERVPPSTALFPIPMSYMDIWSGRPGCLGKLRRERRAVQKMLHVSVMALNFVPFVRFEQFGWSQEVPVR